LVCAARLILVLLLLIIPIIPVPPETQRSIGALGTATAPVAAALDISLKCLGRSLGDSKPLALANAMWALGSLWEQVRPAAWRAARCWMDQVVFAG